MSAILFDSTRPAKVRSARRFGAGILRTLPLEHAPYTFEDASWWAAECAARASRDRRFDTMAREAAELAAVERGHVGL
jgi:hypothetical protein